jgi:hypothetical protein
MHINLPIRIHTLSLRTIKYMSKKYILILICLIIHRVGLAEFSFKRPVLVLLTEAAQPPQKRARTEDATEPETGT